MLLLLVGSSLFINNYDLGIFALALPQIQASLQIPEENLGLYTGIIRFGVLLAFPLAFMADIVGRRRLLLLTVIGMTLSTVLSAFARDATQFLILQTFARCFSYAEEMLCYVIIAEEIAPHLRGWALARLAALGTLGYGLSSLLYGQVDALPHGWRDFYLVGAVGLVLIMIARRSLKETQRFTDLKAARAPTQSFSDHLKPIVSLARAYPGRFVALIGTTAPYSFGIAAAFAFISKFLQETHGYSPAHVGYLQLFGGALSILGFFAAGRIGDFAGRRVVLGVCIPIVVGLFVSFYMTGNPTPDRELDRLPLLLLRLRSHALGARQRTLPDLLSLDLLGRARRHQHGRRHRGPCRRKRALSARRIACALLHHPARDRARRADPGRLLPAGNGAPLARRDFARGRTRRRHGAEAQPLNSLSGV